MNKKNSEKVAVLGASTNSSRFSNKAVRMLTKYGHEVFPVNPQYENIEGLKTFKDLASISDKIDTLSIYIGPQNINAFIESIVQLKPGRVILNPGTESDELESALTSAKIPFLKACTLVLLESEKF